MHMLRCTLLVGALLLALALSDVQGREVAADQNAPSIPIYGNWCGPNHGSGKPIDALDACCEAHDKCYDKNGYFNCDCDKNILECLQGVFISNGPRREDQNAFKTAAMLYFRNAPCRSSGGSWSFFRWLQNLG